MQIKETLNRKIITHQKDISTLIKISNLVDKIRFSGVKIKFEDLVAEEIMNLAKRMKELKDFLDNYNDEELISKKKQ